MYTATLAAMKARMQTVTDGGVVNDYRRHVTTYDGLKAAYTATIGGIAQIRGWDLTWESGALSPDAWESDGRKRMAGNHTYVARSYMSANDAQATDKTHSALLLSMMEALVTCADSLTPRESHVPVTLRSNSYLTFEAPGVGIALVHHGEIAVVVREEDVI